MVKSTRPAATSSGPPMASDFTYSTSENPSRRSNSSARNCGARQIAALYRRRIFFVSGGGSLAAIRGSPRSEAAPKAELLARNLRRLSELTIVFMACLPCGSPSLDQFALSVIKVHGTPPEGVADTRTALFLRERDPQAAWAPESAKLVC